MSWKDNPVLQRELLYRLRPQPSMRSLYIVMGTLSLLAVAMMYLSVTRSARTQTVYYELLNWTLSLEMLLVVALAPAAAANAVSREREQRTWDLLAITLLKPHEIVLGKLFGRLAPLALLLTLGLPMHVLCPFHDWSLLLGSLFGLLVVLMTLVFFGAAGLAASCYSRKTVTATVAAYLFAGAWVFGTLLVSALLALLIATSGNASSFPLLFHPIVVAVEVVDYFQNPQYPRNDALSMFGPWPLLALYSLLTILLVWVMIRTYHYWAYRTG